MSSASENCHSMTFSGRNCSVSFHERADDAEFEAGERLVSHREVEPGWLVDYAFEMGECLEAITAVVMSHPAFPDSSERHPFSGDVNDGVVDAASSETQSGEKFPFQFPVPGENIGGEGSRIPVYVFHRVIDVAVWDDRQYRAEYLIGHNRFLSFSSCCCGPLPCRIPVFWRIVSWRN